MEYKIIASGSEGNALLINGELLIDCGLPYSDIEPYVKELKYVLITHRHGDHYKPETLNKLKYERPSIYILLNEDIETRELKFDPGVLKVLKTYRVGHYLIKVFPLYHNVSNIGFTIIDTRTNISAMYATDTYTLEHLTKMIPPQDYYFIELNHDEMTIDQVMASDKVAGKWSHYGESRENHLSFQRGLSFYRSHRRHTSKLIPLHVSERFRESLDVFLLGII